MTYYGNGLHSSSSLFSMKFCHNCLDHNGLVSNYSFLALCIVFIFTDINEPLYSMHSTQQHQANTWYKCNNSYRPKLYNSLQHSTLLNWHKVPPIDPTVKLFTTFKSPHVQVRVTHDPIQEFCTKISSIKFIILGRGVVLLVKWSACSPSTQITRVWIPLKSTIFL